MSTLRYLKSAAAVLAVALVLGACDHDELVGPPNTLSEQRAHAGTATISDANVVEVIARHDGPDYVFDLSDDVIPSGWTTFELDNRSGATHFVYTARLPEAAIAGAREDGVPLLEYWDEHVVRPIQYTVDLGLPDKEPDPLDLSEKYHDTVLPPWLFDAAPVGGPGFLQGHLSSRTTVYLEPGYYVLECYVKNAEEDLHSYHEMVALLEVKDEPSGAPEPRASLEVNLSTGQIDVDPDIRPGLHTVAVHFEDQTTYQPLQGHDVHLIRLDGWTARETVEWMDPTVPGGMVSADGMRGPTTFLGGTQTATAGSTVYVTVRLEPGEYAWVAEVPVEEEMWETFTVPHGTPTGSR